MDGHPLQPDLLAGSEAAGAEPADGLPRWLEREPPSSMCDDYDTFTPAFLDELVNAVQGPAVDAVTRRRVEQLVRHDRARDLEKPVGHLVREARERLGHAIEMIGRGQPGDLATALRKVEIAAALALAAHDRVRAEIATTLSTKENDQ